MFNWKYLLQKAGVPSSTFSGRVEVCPACGSNKKSFLWSLLSVYVAHCFKCGSKKAHELFQAVVQLPRVDAMQLARAWDAQMPDALRDEIWWIEKPPKTQADVDKAKTWIDNLLAGAQDLTAQTVAGQYLLSRIPKLDLDAIGADLLFHPRLSWKGESGVQKFFPGMLGIARDPVSREIVCLHRTLLEPSGIKAALDVDENCRKLTTVAKLDVLSGEAVALGVAGARLDVCCVAEGIETALAVLVASKYRLRVYAAMNAGNVAKFMPPLGVAKVVNYGEFDKLNRLTGKRASEEANKVLSLRMRVLGLDFDAKFPAKEGQDFLDVWQELQQVRA